MGAGQASRVRAQQGEDGIHMERWPNAGYRSLSGIVGNHVGSIRHGAEPEQGKEGIHEEEHCHFYFIYF